MTSGRPSLISVAVPQRAVLLGQRHELTVRGRAGRPAGVGEEHQREQTGDLRVVGRRGVHTRASRIASPERSMRERSGPLLVA